MHSADDLVADYRAAVLAAAQSAEPQLATKFLFDDEGSRLFGRFLAITPSHYTRIERRLLDGWNAARFDDVAAVVELGAGDATTFLDGLRQGAFPALRMYGAVELAFDRVAQTLREMARLRSRLDVRAFVGDFERCDTWLTATVDAAEKGRALACWLGNSIANIPPDDLRRFLSRARQTAGPFELLVGVGLKGDMETLGGHYSEGQAVFDLFRWNAIQRMNDQCGADWRRSDLELSLNYNGTRGRLESALTLTANAVVRFAAVDYSRGFLKGDRWVVGTTYNYSQQGFLDLVEDAGWTPHILEMDPVSRYALVLLR